jgi:hypothetical protein
MDRKWPSSTGLIDHDQPRLQTLKGIDSIEHDTKEHPHEIPIPKKEQRQKSRPELSDSG